MRAPGLMARALVDLPELLALVDDETARRGVVRAVILREAVREWCERHPTPVAPAWVEEAREELREARWRGVESAQVLREMLAGGAT